MMKRFSGRIVAVVVAGIFFFGPINGGRELLARLGHRDEVPALELIVQLGGAMLAPGLAGAATAKVPAKKKVLPHLAKAPKKTAVKKILQAKKSKKTFHARSEGNGQAGRRGAKVVTKRCEPQSLTYARQRSGIITSRNGRENGPLTWLASEKKLGRTTTEPTAGSVLILGAQGHGMPTGHVAYVEKVSPGGPSTYRVVFSHTNYDRQCHLETDIESLYNRDTMTLDIQSGAWESWGRGLKVAGFIRDI